MPFVIATPTATDTEDLILDGLALNDEILGIEELLCPPPRQRQEWIGAADSEHQGLVRDPLYDNRKVTVPISVIPSGDMDAALDRIGEVLDKLLAASKTQDGIELTWSPGGSTRTVTFDVLAGEIVDLPINIQDGWHLAKAPKFTIELTCKPFWRGVETLTSITSSSTPVVTAELVNNSGDVPALGRLIVTDTASQSRRHVEWGLEGPGTYNPATSLILDSDSLVTSGFAGTQVTQTGAYDPNASGNNAVSAVTFASPTAVCGTGNQSHVGSFRVKARVNVLGDCRVRFSWRAGDGPVSSNAWTTSPAPRTSATPSWGEVDLGTITVPVAVSGTQRWTGQVEVYDPVTAPGTEGAAVDFLILIPVTDGYGKARATYSYRSGVLTGYDAFTGTTAGGALNARVATSGGTWATSGGTTDFAFADDLSGEQVKRSTSATGGARFAVLGSSVFTDTEVSASIYFSGYPATTGAELLPGVIARWVDGSNHLRGMLRIYRALSTGPVTANLQLEEWVGGPTIIASKSITVPAAATWYVVRLIVFASGRAILQLLNADKTAVLGETEATSSTLTSGGTLDDGKPGITDENTGTGTQSRYYDNFSVSVAAAEPVALYSGQSMEFRHDDTIREDATGTYYGRPQSYRGSRFLVPVGTSRVLVKARRNDVDVATNANVTDATQIQIGVTSRGLVVPRA